MEEQFLRTDSLWFMETFWRHCTTRAYSTYVFRHPHTESDYI